MDVAKVGAGRGIPPDHPAPPRRMFRADKAERMEPACLVHKRKENPGWLRGLFFGEKRARAVKNITEHTKIFSEFCVIFFSARF